jgi:hypothetical protein
MCRRATGQSREKSAVVDVVEPTPRHSKGRLQSGEEPCAACIANPIPRRAHGQAASAVLLRLDGAAGRSEANCAGESGLAKDEKPVIARDVYDHFRRSRTVNPLSRWFAPCAVITHWRRGEVSRGGERGIPHRSCTAAQHPGERRLWRDSLDHARSRAKALVAKASRPVGHRGAGSTPGVIEDNVGRDGERLF